MTNGNGWWWLLPLTAVAVFTGPIEAQQWTGVNQAAVSNVANNFNYPSPYQLGSPITPLFVPRPAMSPLYHTNAQTIGKSDSNSHYYKATPLPMGFAVQQDQRSFTPLALSPSANVFQQIRQLFPATTPTTPIQDWSAYLSDITSKAVNGAIHVAPTVFTNPIVPMPMVLSTDAPPFEQSPAPRRVWNGRTVQYVEKTAVQSVTPYPTRRPMNLAAILTKPAPRANKMGFSKKKPMKPIEVPIRKRKPIMRKIGGFDGEVRFAQTRRPVEKMDRLRHYARLPVQRVTADHMQEVTMTSRAPIRLPSTRLFARMEEAITKMPKMVQMKPGFSRANKAKPVKLVDGGNSYDGNLELPRIHLSSATSVDDELRRKTWRQISKAILSKHFQPMREIRRKPSANITMTRRKILLPSRYQ